MVVLLAPGRMLVESHPIFWRNVKMGVRFIWGQWIGSSWRVVHLIFLSPTRKTGSNLYSTFFAPPKNTPISTDFFLEVSVIISDDLYEMLVLFGSLPITKKYIHHNLFSLGKNLSALFGAVIFWSKTWNQGITCWFLSWDPADFADVFAPKPSIKKCSAPLAFFF